MENIHTDVRVYRGKKTNLSFAYESRDTLKSFSLFLAVKIISKLNMEHSV